MTRRSTLLLGIVLAVIVVGGASTWTFVFRPVNVQVAQRVSDVPVQVFGLGTVEARVTSKVGFKVSGVLADVRADEGVSGRRKWGHRPIYRGAPRCTPLRHGWHDGNGCALRLM